jgi:hypothetical protein
MIRSFWTGPSRCAGQDRLGYFDFFSRQTLPGIVATNVLKRPGKSLALAEKECQVAKSRRIALCPMNPDLEEAFRPAQPDGGYANCNGSVLQAVTDVRLVPRETVSAPSGRLI